MKKCPKCHKTYNDEQNFCFDDAGVLVTVGAADTPTMYVPNEPPPTQMVSPQQMQNWQQPNVSPPSGFNAPPSGFNAPPFTPSAQNQTALAGGNKLAWVGFGFLIGAVVLTIFSIGFRSLWVLGFCSYGGDFCNNGTLGVITLLVTGVAFLGGVVALILAFMKPQSFGRKILSFSVGLISGFLFFVQLIFVGIGYSEGKSSASYIYNYNSSNSSSNYSNTNKTPTPTPTPLSLDKAIIGKWREDGTTSTITFYDDKSMLIDSGGKLTTGKYEINGANKVAFSKSGVKFKDSTIYVTGDKMTMDGTKLTKVN